MSNRFMLVLAALVAFTLGTVIGTPGAQAASDLGYSGYTVKTAAYTVTAAENGTTFTNRGDGDAITFTLPAPFANAHYRFVSIAAFAITVAADTADTLIGYNDLDLDSISGPATTPGVWIEVVSDGTSWIAIAPTVGASYTLTD
jgi:hypothetical protein